MARGADSAGKATRSDRLKIFISYSRTDAATADALVTALEARGFEVTIDKRNLPFGEEWQKELVEFIRLSDTVIWLVSNPSIESKWVNWELDEVKARNKRLVPVMVGLVDPAKLPRQLGKIHILPLDRVFDHARDLDTLVRVLETDHAWLKQATLWQDRAAVWQANDRASGRLLSRGELADAERWKDTRPAKAPPPAQEVMDLLLASRQAVNRQQRWIVGTSMAFSIAAIAAAGYALALRNWGAANESRALAQERVAVAERDRAMVQRNLALATNSRILARDSERALAERDPVKALLIALEALPAKPQERPHIWQAERAAYAALFEWRHLSTLKAPRGWGDWRSTFSADGAVVFGESEFTDRVNSARLWRAYTGEEIASYEGVPGGPRPAVIDKTRRRLFVNPAPGKGDSGLFDLATSTFTRIAVPGTRILLADICQNGERLLTAHDDGKARLWQAATGTLLAEFNSGNSAPHGLLLSFDGRRASIWPSEYEALIYDDSAVLRCRLRFSDNDAPTDWAFAIGDTRLVTVREHQPEFTIVGSTTASVWDLERCTPQVVEADLGTARIASLTVLSKGDRMVLSTIHFSPSGTPDPGTVVVWDIAAGRAIHRFDGVLHHITSGDAVIVLMQDPASKKRLLVADLDGRRVALQADDTDPRLQSVRINEQGTRIAAKWSLLDDHRLWDAVVGRQVAKLEARSGNEAVRALPLSFSPDGKLLLAASGKDGHAQLWNAETGTLVAVLDTGGGLPVGATFSADNKLIAIPANGGTRHVMAATGTSRTLRLGEGILEANFTTDGAQVVGRSNDGELLAWDTRTGARLMRSVVDMQRLHAQASRPSADEDDNASFEVRARVPSAGTAELAGKDKALPPEPDADTDETRGQAIAARQIRNLHDKQRQEDARRGIRDLAILVHLGDTREPWHWLVGNDGRIALVPADETLMTPLKIMNGRSAAATNVHIPDSHTLLMGFYLNEIAISPDGASLLTIGTPVDKADTTMRLWRKGQDRPVAEIRIEADRIVAEARFDPTGRRIFVTYNCDGTMQVLSADTLDEVAQLPLGGIDPTTFDIGPDGTRILTETDGRLLLWRIEPTVDALVAEARNLLPRCLAVAERNLLQLDAEPPRWCITGPALEGVSDSTKWIPTRPYHTSAWRDWLAARDRGERPLLPRSE
jgi:WD40 repeat protein